MPSLNTPKRQISVCVIGSIKHPQHTHTPVATLYLVAEAGRSCSPIPMETTPAASNWWMTVSKHQLLQDIWCWPVLSGFSVHTCAGILLENTSYLSSCHAVSWEYGHKSYSMKGKRLNSGKENLPACSSTNVPEAAAGAVLTQRRGKCQPPMPRLSC